MSGPARRMTDLQVEEAVRLYADDWSVRRLGRRYGMSVGGISHVLRKAGVQMRPRGNPNPNFWQLSDEERAESCVWVDPIWGRLGYLMYEKRDRRGFSHNGGSRSGSRIDLGSPPE